MKPDDNLINITPVSEVQKRTEVESCPMTVLSYSNRASVIVSCTPQILDRFLPAKNRLQVHSAQRMVTSLQSEVAVCFTKTHNVSRASMSKIHLNIVQSRKLYS